MTPELCSLCPNEGPVSASATAGTSVTDIEQTWLATICRPSPPMSARLGPRPTAPSGPQGHLSPVAPSGDRHPAQHLIAHAEPAGSPQPRPQPQAESETPPEAQSAAQRGQECYDDQIEVFEVPGAGADGARGQDVAAVDTSDNKAEVEGESGMTHGEGRQGSCLQLARWRLLHDT